MRILHVITSLRTGGAEKLMVDLLPRLNEDGIECDLLTFDGSLTPFRKDLENKRVKIYDFGERNHSSYSLKNLLKLIPFLRRYDIVHTHNTAPQLFAAIGSVLCSVVLCTTEHTTSNRRRGWKWYAPIDRWMYSRYRKIICISEKTESNLREAIGDASYKILTIHNGIDVKVYSESKPLDIKSEHVRCRYALVQVAGFRYQKDQDTVIKSLKFLDESVHLFLVGDGARRKELESLIADLHLDHRVHMLGIRTDVANILKCADIAIMSSHWEGFGLAAVEAMAAGIPVVATNIDGLAQVVGNAGILFEHEDALGLANSIKSLIEDKELYDITAERCANRAYDFDISKMALRYHEVYISINQERL